MALVEQGEGRGESSVLLCLCDSLCLLGDLGMGQEGKSVSVET